MKKKLASGTAYLIIAQFLAVLANYSINIGIGRILGSEIYGIFGVLMSLYLLNTSFLNTGIPRSVSKFIAESKNGLKNIFVKSFRLQLYSSLSFGFIYIIFSKLIAKALKDSSLTYYIIFMGIMVVPIAIRSLYTNGYLNGLRMFAEQSIVKSVHHILRVGLVFLFVLMGFKIWGILVGYFISVTLTIWLSHYYLKDKMKSTGEFKNKKLINFSIPITLTAINFTIIKNANPFILKLLGIDYSLIGFYTAAAALSNVSFLIFQPLSLTLMPSISKAISEKNNKLIQKYIRQSTRYLLLLITPIMIIVATTADELVTFFYTSSFVSAGAILSILIISTTCFSIFRVFASIINGAGKPNIDLIITTIGVFLSLTLTLIFVPIYGAIGAAISLLITAILSVLLSLIYIYKRFRTVIITAKSFIRIVISSFIIYIMATRTISSGWKLLIHYGVWLITYFLILIILNEITIKDLKLVKSILKKSS